LLNGWRGDAPVSREAIITAMLRLSSLVVSCAWINETEINPFRVFADRGLVLDAFISSRG
jgi:ATP-grasp domain